MAIIIGIDPSLTGTGIARVDTDDRLVADVQTITSTGRKDATWPQRATRIDNLAQEIASLCQDELHEISADLVVLEAPSLGQQRQGGTLDRHGLWWGILARLTYWGIPYACVAPAARAKYATGKGNASKDQVLLEVARRFPHVPVTDNNQADALVLAAMGADHLGTPLVELPKAHREALDKVAWPVNVAGVGCAQGVGA